MSKDTSRQESNDEEKIELEYVYIPFTPAFEVAEAIYAKFGGKVKDFGLLEKATGVKGGGLRERIVNAKRYGLIEGRGEMKPTELSMRIIKPTIAGEGDLAIRESILSVPLFKDIYLRYRGSVPEDEVLFKNSLEREFNISTKISSRVLNAIKKNFEIIKDLNLPEERIEEKIDKAMKEFEAPKRTITGENFLFITFGEHSHEIPIKTQNDWKIAKAILNGLEEGWVETKKNHNQGESAKDKTGDES